MINNVVQFRDRTFKGLDYSASTRYDRILLESEKLIMGRNYPGAIKVLEGAEIHSPFKADAYFYLGVAYFRSGKLDDAFKNLNLAPSLEEKILGKNASALLHSS